ncbi:MAG TPA: YceI family protein [Cytophagaceae bacterium]|jgi:polyisoprenoid-binding protein YceI|nr:YceI family protein [Cytophagaceae bacterium]
MKMWYACLMIVVVTAASMAQGHSRAVDYKKSSVSFKIRNAGINVEGEFKDYTVNIQFDPKALSSAHFEGKIKVKSISTGIHARDNHLCKEDYFYADKYPEINFKSTSVQQQGDGYVIKGKLTIKDAMKDVSIPLKVSKTGIEEIIEGNLTIDRLDFHVGGNSWVMSDEVMIQIKITTQ